jgi:phosphoribosylformimino-5-aminoimidazole carboxamide ribotide isomerase
MRVIPVIDLQAGQVVRGIAGRRDEYRPIESQLVSSAAPVVVARALVEQFGCDTLYLADLDAIAGAAPAWDIYEQLAAMGVALWVDAGLSSNSQVVELAEWRAGKVRLAGIVAGLESLPALDCLTEWLDVAGSQRLIFSLDLKAGRPIVRDQELGSRTGIEIALAARSQGVRRLIVLDLARVGMGGGVGTDELCRAVRAVDSQIELIGGGGVRGVDDLRTLAAAGCDAALVASALHDGRLTRADIAALEAR